MNASVLAYLYFANTSAASSFLSSVFPSAVASSFLSSVFPAPDSVPVVCSVFVSDDVPSFGFWSSVDGLQLIRSKKKRQSPEKLPPIYFNQDGALLRHPGKKKDFGNPKSF